MKKEITLPIGRMVQGDGFTPNLTDMQGNPRVFKNGPNAGKPNPQYMVGIAYSKQDTSFSAVYSALQEVARASFPQFFDAAGNCTHPQFAWKLIDGDGYDSNGKSNASKEGFAGCWVLRLTSGFAPKVFRKGQYDPSQVVTDPRELPRGYYIRALIDITGNDNPQKPGLYLNLKLVEIDKPGEVISNGPDASAAFAATASPGAYQGAPLNSPAPVMTAPAQMPHMVGFAAPSVSPTIPVPVASAPAPVMAAPAPMAVMPAPHMVGIAPPPAAPVVAPPPAPVKRMTAAAQGTYDQYIASGWNDAQLIANGLLEA